MCGRLILPECRRSLPKRPLGSFARVGMAHRRCSGLARTAVTVLLVQICRACAGRFPCKSHAALRRNDRPGARRVLNISQAVGADEGPQHPAGPCRQAQSITLSLTVAYAGVVDSCAPARLKDEAGRAAFSSNVSVLEARPDGFHARLTCRVRPLAELPEELRRRGPITLASWPSLDRSFSSWLGPPTANIQHISLRSSRRSSRKERARACSLMPIAIQVGGLTSRLQQLHEMRNRT